MSTCSCPCPVHWSHVLSREWRCCWISADRRCPYYIRVINNFIAYWGVLTLEVYRYSILLCFRILVVGNIGILCIIKWHLTLYSFKCLEGIWNVLCQFGMIYDFDTPHLQSSLHIPLKPEQNSSTCIINNIGANQFKFQEPGRNYHGPLARYVKLRVVHKPGKPGSWSPPLRVSHPDMHHDTCVTHMPSCMPGSITSGFLCSWWRGKRSQHSRRMRNPQFCVSGKRPMFTVSHHLSSISSCYVNTIFFPFTNNKDKSTRKLISWICV